ncbi:hypothetical protein [Promicromonospora aerolata]|uniref:EF-hand domain-containing protein n=1 Tax=Promicromonospora aerolata TaxID=195749 RepID=A0ABW4V4K1_9MICO
MRSHPVVVDPPRGRGLYSGLIGIVVALALLVTGVHLSPGAEAAEAGVQRSSTNLSRFVATNLSGFTARAGLPEDEEEGGDYTYEVHLGDTSEMDMDAVREALDALNAEDKLSDYLKRQAEIHSDEIGPLPEIPDIEADFKLDGSKIHVTIPADYVHTEANWWQSFIAGIAGSIAGVLAAGACMFLLEGFGPVVLRRACGFVAGFMSTFAIVLINNAFDGKLQDRDAWASTLAVSLAVGLMGAGIGELIQGEVPALLTRVKNAIGAMVDGFKKVLDTVIMSLGSIGVQLFVWAKRLIDLLREKIGPAIDNVINRLRGQSCEPPTGADGEPPTGAENIGRDLSDLMTPSGGGGGNASGAYIDIDGDGRPDFVDNDGDGSLSVGDFLVGRVLAYNMYEPIYELIEVTSIEQVS